MNSDQNRGKYIGIKGAVGLVMPEQNPYPVGDLVGRESPPQRLAGSLGRTEAVQIGVDRAREVPRKGYPDTRIGDRMRAKYEQGLADEIRGADSEEGKQEGAQVDNVQALGIHGKRLEAVLTGLAYFVEELPKSRADRQAAIEGAAGLRRELDTYHRELTEVLNWIDAYKSGDAKRLEQQRQITGEQFGPIRREVQEMKEGIREQIDENFQFFGGVTKRMDELTVKVEEFLGVISHGYRGQTDHLANAMDKVRAQMNVELDSVRRTMENQLGKENLGKLVFDAVVQASATGHTMISYDSLGRLSGAATEINEAAGNLGGRLKYLEKTQSDIRRMRKIITGMRRAAVAIGKDRRMADEIMFEEVDQINDDVKVQGEKTRSDVLRAVGVTTLQEKQRYQTAYRVLEGIRNSVAGLQSAVAEAVEGSVEKVILRYRVEGFSDQQIGQLQSVMIGGILGTFDNMPDSFYRRLEVVTGDRIDKSIKDFRKDIGENGVPLTEKDRKGIIGSIGELTKGVTQVVKKLAALEQRLPTEDLLTEKGVRTIAREEGASHIVKLVNDMKLGERIDDWVGKTAEAAAEKAAKKVADDVAKSVEKAMASKPKREPRPEGEGRPRKPKIDENVATPESLMAGFTRLIRKKKKD